MSSVRPADIKNKVKRGEVYAKQEHIKRKAKQELRRKRKRQREELGEDAPPLQIPKTLDTMRENDGTFVTEKDEELTFDETTDEFSPYFLGEKKPKVMITTTARPNPKAFAFIKDFMGMIPNAFYYKRANFILRDIIKYASNLKFTHLFVVQEKKGEIHSVIITHLPNGPAACFRFTSQELHHEIDGSGISSSFLPELVLNNFQTRLGHRVSRLLGSLLPHCPEFEGRRVVTFHNQRDFIFVRHHRYQFRNGKKVALQEIGPRFTLKMKYLKAGILTSADDEYEWKHKAEMDTSRKRFFL